MAIILSNQVQRYIAISSIFALLFLVGTGSSQQGTCKLNEVLSSKPDWCCDARKRCDDPIPICERPCPPGSACVCKPDYVRPFDSAQAPCIPLAKCCKQPNEVWKPCSNGCEATCNNGRPICTKECVIDGGCECDTSKGYIREFLGGRCIKMSECPPSRGYGY